MVRSYLLNKGLYKDVLVPNSVSAGIKTKAEIPIWEMEERILASGLTHRLRLCLSLNLVMLMQCLQIKQDLDLDACGTFGISIFYTILLVTNIILINTHISIFPGGKKTSYRILRPSRCP